MGVQLFLGQCEVHVGSPYETKGMGVGRLTPIPVSSTGQALTFPHQRGRDSRTAPYLRAVAVDGVGAARSRVRLTPSLRL